MAVDPSGHVLGMLALQEVGDPLGELHDLDSALEGAGRVGQRLAVLLGDQLCQLRPVGLEQLTVAGQDAGAAERRRFSPGRERLLSRGHGTVDVGRTGIRNAADHLAERRVVRRRRPARSSPGLPCRQSRMEGPVSSKRS